MAVSDAVRIEKLRIKELQRARNYDLVMQLIRNPVVQSIAAVEILNELVIRYENHEAHFILSPQLATVVGGTIGAAIVAQQIGPQGVAAAASSAAEILKSLGGFAVGALA